VFDGVDDDAGTPAGDDAHATLAFVVGAQVDP